MNRAKWMLLLLATAVSSPGTAGAFCRATDCLARYASDPEVLCTYDENQCIFDGIPLGWPLGARVDFELDEEGSWPELADAESVRAALDQAIKAWNGVRCEDEKPSLGLRLKKESSDEEPEILVIPIREDWPYQETVLAKTILSYGLESGAILGATIELNFTLGLLSTEPDEEKGEIDLGAVLTHELGHVAGLDHTTALGATMQSETASNYSGELTSLEEDDKAGYCALYPPKPEGEDNEYDLSDDVVLKVPPKTGCFVAPAPAGPSGSAHIVLVALVAGLCTGWRRLRKAARSPDHAEHRVHKRS